MINKLFSKVTRRLDVQVLWPLCKKNAPDIEVAKEAFRFHTQFDIGWYKYLSEKEIMKIIQELK